MIHKEQVLTGDVLWEHTIPLKSYSVINKHYSKESVIEFINTASLEFDLRTVSIYEDNVPVGQTIESVIHFNVSSKDKDDDRYTQGIVSVSIRKGDNECVIEGVSLKLYYTINNEWEYLDVDDKMLEYIRLNHLQSITETFNIAEELLCQCISTYTIGKVIKVSYDYYTSVGILYNSAMARSNGSNNKELLSLVKSRVGNDSTILEYQQPLNYL